MKKESNLFRKILLISVLIVIGVHAGRMAGFQQRVRSGGFERHGTSAKNSFRPGFSKGVEGAHTRSTGTGFRHPTFSQLPTTDQSTRQSVTQGNNGIIAPQTKIVNAPFVNQQIKEIGDIQNGSTGLNFNNVIKNPQNYQNNIIPITLQAAIPTAETKAFNYRSTDIDIENKQIEIEKTTSAFRKGSDSSLRRGSQPTTKGSFGGAPASKTSFARTPTTDQSTKQKVVQGNNGIIAPQTKIINTPFINQQIKEVGDIENGSSLMNINNVIKNPQNYQNNIVPITIQAAVPTAETKTFSIDKKEIDIENKQIEIERAGAQMMRQGAQRRPQFQIPDFGKMFP